MGANCGTCADNTTVEDMVSQPVLSQAGEDEVEECHTEFVWGGMAKEHGGLPSRTASDVSSNASTALPAPGAPQRAASDAFTASPPSSRSLAAPPAPPSPPGTPTRRSGVRLRRVASSSPASSPPAPAYDFVVTVTKNPGDGFAVKDDVLGAQLGNTDKGAAIFNIHQGGLLDSWNQAAHPDELLHPGFVITKVNGRTGYWKIVEELRRPGVLNIKVSTTPPESAGPRWFEEIAEKGRGLESAGGRNSYMLRLPCFFFEFCVFA